MSQHHDSADILHAARKAAEAGEFYCEECDTDDPDNCVCLWDAYYARRGDGCCRLVP